MTNLNEVLKRGSFSDTTTVDGKANLVVGGFDRLVDYSSGNDNSKIGAGYSYQFNLNTSFNGCDNLFARLRGSQWGDRFTQTRYIPCRC